MRTKLIVYISGIVVVCLIGYFSLTQFKIIPGLKIKDIFGSKEIKIEDTQIDIKEVREIGKLTTAEYYGEVYADLLDAYSGIIEQFPPEKFLMYKDSLMDAFPGLKQALRSKSDEGGVTSDFAKKKSDFVELENDINAKRQNFSAIEKAYRQTEMAFNATKADFEKKQTAFEKQKKEFQAKSAEFKGFLGLKKKQNQEQLNKLTMDFENEKTSFDKSKAGFDEAKKTFVAETEKYKKDRAGLDAAEKTFELKKVEFAREEKKLFDFQRKLTTAVDRNLVYIGRGWVKVGFDLRKLEDKDLVASRDTLIVNLPPIEIINQDINPWFIEKKVKGYELYMQKGSNFTNQEVKAVKAMCIKRLVEQAYNKKVIQRGEESGISSVENFFKLMGFKNVRVSIKKSFNLETPMVDNSQTKKDSADLTVDSAAKVLQ
jgi:hypothetical protein